MAQEIDLGGTKYVSSKRAAEISGYAQDYIGQLARSGQVEARRVSGLWYVLEESLVNHKAKADQFVPEPPDHSSQTTMDSSITFDGRDFISAARAAKITGYSQDYVTQLARGSKVLARQVGNRWYVDREALVSHKEEKDSLLAAVQSESVGLGKATPAPEILKEEPITVPEEPLKYITDTTELLPTFESPIEASEAARDEEYAPSASIEQSNVEEEEEQNIPIRIIAPKIKSAEQPQVQFDASLRNYVSTPRMTMFLLVFLGVGLSLAAATVYMENQRSHLSPAGAGFDGRNTAVITSSGDKITSKATNLAYRFLSRELYYHR